MENFNVSSILAKIDKNKTILHRVIKSNKMDIHILFLKQIIDTEKLSLYVFSPILEYFKENNILTPEEAFYSVIQTEDNLLQSVENDGVDAESKILDSYVLLLFEGYNEYIAINLKNIAKKSISGPELGDSLTAPKDSFTENLEINLSLLRYRIKDEKLVVNTRVIGKRTKTMVSMCYISDVANPTYVDIIDSKLSQIDVEGITASGQISHFIADKKVTLFPQSGLVERSDTAANELLNGKILILVEGSGIGLVTPKVFMEFLLADDDQYENTIFASFSKLIRVLSVFLSLVMTPLYVALVTFHSEILPTQYILTLAAGRVNVIFSALLEVLIVEILLEIFKEALIRVPKNIGSAVGLVGAIVIGQSAVEVGIFSPLLLLLASFSLLATFIAPDYSVTMPLRILKFGLLILTSYLGLLGLFMGIFYLAILIVSTKTTTVPYLTPFAPFNFKNIINEFFSNKATNNH